jgi:hypothetical protein
MARRVVGLIGNGTGPVVHIEGKCRIEIKGLKKGGTVTFALEERQDHVFEADGVYEISSGRRGFFTAEDASRELVCNILMES